MIAVLSVWTSIMEIEGPGLKVQKMGIVKQPDPVKPPPNNTEEGKCKLRYGSNMTVGSKNQ